MPPRKQPKPARRLLQQRSRQESGLDRNALAGATLIGLACAIVYLPALHGGFLLDNDLLLTNNPLIKATDGFWKFWFSTEAEDYWPVSNSMLWLEWRLWGMSSTGYHATNLLLHIVESLLIWRILWRLAVPGAFVAAVAFAVHPVNVETVAWIAQRKSLLAMLFSLLSILWYVNAEIAAQPQARRWYGLSFFAFVLAVLSKVSAVVLPALLLLVGWWRRPADKRDALRIAPFIAVAVALLRVNLWFRTHGAVSHAPTASLIERSLGAAGALWFYLGKALLPINLIFIYPERHVQADAWLALAAAVAVTPVLWWYRSGPTRSLLFVWTYFCVALLPVLGFTDVGDDQQLVVADHYQHLALIGVTALAGAAWDKWRRADPSSRWAADGAAIAVSAALALLTWQQSSLYANATTLYQATIERNPDAWRAHTNLGLALAAQGRLDEAITHYQEALRVKPHLTAVHNDLASALHDRGRTAEAIEHYQEALRSEPNSFVVHNNLAIALQESGRSSEAIEHYREAVRLAPNSAEVHNNLANALAADPAQLPEAITHYREALRLRPDYADARGNLRRALAKAGLNGDGTE